MDRRKFLGVAAGSVLSAGGIAWLAHHFSTRQGWDRAIAAMGDVSLAYARAFALGKPLLVLVIPEERDLKWARGEDFGALLNHGGAEVYLDLALCELVCATVATVGTQLRGTTDTGEPLMLLVETEDSGARITPIEPEIYHDAPSFLSRGNEIERTMEDRVEVIAATLHAGLLPAAGSLADRARLQDERLPRKETDAVRAAIAADAPLVLTTLDRCAAIVRSVAESPGAPKPHALEALAYAAAGRVVGTAPPGAKWATNTGCGVDIEGEPGGGFGACGMGCVPELADRFLWFYTKE